jgi:restriction system protein
VIPNDQQFIFPSLEVTQVANGGELKLRDVINHLAEKFNLAEIEKAETLPSTRQGVLDNCIGWVLEQNRCFLLSLRG